MLFQHTAEPTPEVYRDRSQRLGTLLSERGLDAAVVYSAPLAAGWASTSSGNTLYLANWQSVGQPTNLLLSASGDAVIFGTGSLDANRWPARKGLWVERRYGRIDPATARKLLKEMVGDTARIGLIGGAEMPMQFHAPLVAHPTKRCFVDCDDLLVELKRQGYAAEEYFGRQAVANATAMLAAAVDGIRAGKRIFQAAADAHHAGRHAGSDWTDVWIGSGSAADEMARIAWQGDRRVRKGEIVNIIVFNTYNGRHAQLIRTGVKGHASARQRQYVDACIAVQERGIALLRPGRHLLQAATELDSAARELSPPLPPRAAPPFRSGHLQGVQYIEPGDSDPFIASQLADTTAAEKVIVRSGMRMVIHPSLDVPDLGWFCVGDNVLIHTDGPEVLSEYPRTCFEA
jgi:Xaa-Pro aminopeptidase